MSVVVFADVDVCEMHPLPRLPPMHLLIMGLKAMPFGCVSLCARSKWRAQRPARPATCSSAGCASMWA